MLHYVPCQRIQDRRACNQLFKTCKLCPGFTNVILFCIIDEQQPLFEDLKFYISRKDEVVFIDLILCSSSCGWSYTDCLDWNILFN